MDRDSISSLCRICLESGATCLIFKEIKDEDSIHSKLRKCFKEKVEDMEGYPRNICFTCKDTLDIVNEFINKFKESHRVLKEGLIRLKCENNEASSNFETDQLAEIEIELRAIKSEPKTFLDSLEVTEQFIDFFQPLEDGMIEEDTKHTVKVEKKAQRKANKYEKRTNKVASSILEGEFAWTGETWCLKSTLLKIPKDKEVRYRRRNTRLKLPKKATIKQEKLCDVCGDTFKTQYKLNLHRKKVHFSNPTQCPQCLRICSSENNLLRHIKRKHSTDKEFICVTCGKGFAFKGELTNHVNKVHKDRPKPMYGCKFCDKKFKSQKSVVIHERSAHTGERPAECSICFKAFFHEEYLKEHMRLHTGEAPFKCPVCGRGYAQRGNMKSHLRIHRISEVDAATLSKMKPNYIKLLKV